MKKIYLAMTLAALAALVSCTKENSLVISDETATDPVIQSFSAFQDGTKAIVDGVSVKWNSTDTISLFEGGTTSKGVLFSTEDDNVATATFTGTGAVKTGGYYYAAFPASAVVNWNKEGDGKLRVIIPATQFAVAGGLPSNSAPMWAKTDGTSLAFNHVGGYIKVEFTSASPTDIVEIEFADGGTAKACGGYAITIGEETPAVSNTTYSQTTKLVMEDGSAFGVGVYYFAVRPRIFKDGIKVTFKNSAGKTCEKTTASSLDLTAGHVQSRGVVKNIKYSTGGPALGDVYKEGEVSKGIVCHVETSYYAVMSLAKSDGIQWATEKTNTMAVTDKADGRNNCATVAKEAGYQTTYPAIAYCLAMGDGWYLPGTAEMITIIGDCGLDSDAGLNAFNTKITAAGGTAITTPYGSYRFWCSNTSADGTKAYYAYYSTNKSAIASTTQWKNSTSYSARCLKRISL